MKKTIYLKVITLLLLLAVASMANAQQWEELHTGVTEDLYDVCCIDANTLFVCGQNGVILKSEDGGNSWQEKFRQAGFDWYTIRFLDLNTGFVLGINDDIGYNEILLKTLDGGETWLDFGDPFNEYNYCSPSTCDLFIVDSDTLYVACDQLIKSTDGGSSFSQLEIEGLEATQKLYFDGNVGYIVWGAPGEFIGTHVAKTTDYGSSWEGIFSFDYSEYGVEQSVFHDKDHVSLYGSFVDGANVEYNEIKTEDGFATSQWLLNETIPIGYWTPFPPASGVSFTDNQSGIVVFLWYDFNPNSAISTYQTQDGGNTWNELGTINCTYSDYSAISCCDGIYYLTLQKGNVYKLKMTYEGILEEKGKTTIFPNPASNMLFVRGNEKYELIIYDIFGRVLLQHKITDEMYRIELGGFPSGIYYVGIKNRGGSVTFQKILKQ